LTNERAKKERNKLLTFLQQRNQNTKLPGLLFFLPMLAKVFLEQDLEGLDQEHQHVFFV
jgi:hypothetical protein